MKPDATPATITWIGRGISLVTTIVAMLIGLFWDKGLSDLAKVQFGLSLQCIPTFFVGLFAWGPTDCHPWSLAAGGIVGCIMTFSLYFGYIKGNDDAVPMDAGVTSTFFNCVLVFLIEIVRRLVTGSMFNKSDAALEETTKMTNSFQLPSTLSRLKSKKPKRTLRFPIVQHGTNQRLFDLENGLSLQISFGSQWKARGSRSEIQLSYSCSSSLLP